MLVKAVQKDGLTVEMYKNETFFGFDAYTVICNKFSKSYENFNEANKIFEMFVLRGGIWH